MRADVLEKLGLQPGDDLSQIPEEALRAVGYRIPHQGKSSTVIMEDWQYPACIVQQVYCPPSKRDSHDWF